MAGERAVNSVALLSNQLESEVRVPEQCHFQADAEIVVPKQSGVQQEKIRRTY